MGSLSNRLNGQAHTDKGYGYFSGSLQFPFFNTFFNAFFDPLFYDSLSAFFTALIFNSV